MILSYAIHCGCCLYEFMKFQLYKLSSPCRKPYPGNIGPAHKLGNWRFLGTNEWNRVGCAHTEYCSAASLYSAAALAVDWKLGEELDSLSFSWMLRKSAGFSSRIALLCSLCSNRASTLSLRNLARLFLNHTYRKVKLYLATHFRSCKVKYWVECHWVKSAIFLSC